MAAHARVCLFRNHADFLFTCAMSALYRSGNRRKYPPALLYVLFAVSNERDYWLRAIVGDSGGRLHGPRTFINLHQSCM